MTTELVAYLAELDRRRLWAAAGYSSLFDYATGLLGYSEAAALRRVRVARLTRRMPAVLEALRAGRAHLSGLCALAPVLSPDNVEDWLDRTAGRSKRVIEEMVALASPKAAGEGARRLKARPLGRAGGAGPEAQTGSPPDGPADITELNYGITFVATGTLLQKFEEAKALLSHAVPSGDAESILVRALDLLIVHERKRRFATAEGPRSEAVERALDDAHTADPAPAEEPAGIAADPRLTEMLDGIFESEGGSLGGPTPLNGDASRFGSAGVNGAQGPRAATHSAEPLTEETRSQGESRGAGVQDRSWEQSEAAAPDCSRDESGGAAAPDCSRDESGGAADPECLWEPFEAPAERSSRYIPASVRREVYKRDEGRCAFVSSDGAACNSQHQLELHHIHAWARGGGHDASNLELRCRVHNTQASIAEFGPEVALRFERRLKGGQPTGEATEGAE